MKLPHGCRLTSAMIMADQMDTDKLERYLHSVVFHVCYDLLGHCTDFVVDGLLWVHFNGKSITVRIHEKSSTSEELKNAEYSVPSTLSTQQPSTSVNTAPTEQQTEHTNCTPAQQTSISINTAPTEQQSERTNCTPAQQTSTSINLTAERKEANSGLTQLFKDNQMSDGDDVQIIGVSNLPTDLVPNVLLQSYPYYSPMVSVKAYHSHRYHPPTDGSDDELRIEKLTAGRIRKPAKSASQYCRESALPSTEEFKRTLNCSEKLKRSRDHSPDFSSQSKRKSVTNARNLANVHSYTNQTIPPAYSYCSARSTQDLDSFSLSSDVIMDDILDAYQFAQQQQQQQGGTLDQQMWDALHTAQAAPGICQLPSQSFNLMAEPLSTGKNQKEDEIELELLLAEQNIHTTTDEEFYATLPASPNLQKIIEASRDLDFICPLCNLSIHGFHNLDNHTQKVHDKVTMCPECGKMFKHQSARNRHIVAVHSSDKNFTCGLCQHTFTRADSRQKHYRRRHAHDLKTRQDLGPAEGEVISHSNDKVGSGVGDGGDGYTQCRGGTVKSTAQATITNIVPYDGYYTEQAVAQTFNKPSLSVNQGHSTYSAAEPTYTSLVQCGAQCDSLVGHGHSALSNTGTGCNSRNGTGVSHNTLTNIVFHDLASSHSETALNLSPVAQSQDCVDKNSTSQPGDAQNMPVRIQHNVAQSLNLSQPDALWSTPNSSNINSNGYTDQYQRSPVTQSDLSNRSMGECAEFSRGLADALSGEISHYEVTIPNSGSPKSSGPHLTPDPTGPTHSQPHPQQSAATSSDSLDKSEDVLQKYINMS